MKQFVLGRLIGENRYTEVYAGNSSKHSEPVAIKSLKVKHHANRTLRARYSTNVLRWAKFQHPHLVKVHDVRSNSVQVVMELMHRQLGFDMFREQPDHSRLQRMLAHALDGLNELHKYDRLHLNIKPSNLLSNSKGDFKLSDGFLHLTGTDEPLPIPTSGLEFVAPEQVNEESWIGPGCDIYALGMIALFCIDDVEFKNQVAQRHGIKLNDRASWFQWHATAADNPTAEQLDPKIDPKLATIINNMTRKQVDERYYSAEEAIADFAFLESDNDLPDHLSNLSSSSTHNSSLGKELFNELAPRIQILSGSECGKEIAFEDPRSFQIGDGSCPTLQLTPESTGTFLLNDDNETWQFTRAKGRPFVINNVLREGTASVRSGDILRLGSTGPDLMFSIGKLRVDRTFMREVIRKRKFRTSESKHGKKKYKEFIENNSATHVIPDTEMAQAPKHATETTSAARSSSHDSVAANPTASVVSTSTTARPLTSKAPTDEKKISFPMKFLITIVILSVIAFIIYLVS